jgi:glucose uptake protein GlcU
MDYSAGYFVVSCFPLLLASVLTPSDQWEPIRWFMKAIAGVGGSLLSCGNLSMQYATSVYGAPLTTVLALQASLTVVLGTCLNYMIEPARTPRPLLLAMGVLVFLAAIVLAAYAQVMYSRMKNDQIVVDDNEVQIKQITPKYSFGRPPLPPQVTHDKEAYKEESLPNYYCSSEDDNSIDGNSNIRNSSTHSQVMCNFICVENTLMGGLCNVNSVLVEETEKQTSYHGGSPWVGEDDGILEATDQSAMRSNTTSDHSCNPIISMDRSRLCSLEPKENGLVLALLGGICFGFFTPAFNIAVNDPFDWTDEISSFEEASRGSVLAVGRINMWFSLSFWITSVVGNTWLLKRQYFMKTQRVHSVATVLRNYLFDEGLLDRQLAFAAGVICALGNVLQFQGGQLVGWATSDLVQAYPLVSTFWDVLLFGEFRRVHVCSNLAMLLAGMYVAYLAGIVLVAKSSQPPS